jgi:hypothetical protein
MDKSVDEMLCSECKKQEYEHEDREGRRLCWSCMQDLELAWDHDEHEFVSKYVTCSYCGGWETWCECCATYSQNCCVDYGTCGCS